MQSSALKQHVEVHGSREDMGVAAANAAASAIHHLICSDGHASVIFSCAASQMEFFKHLRSKPVDWSRVRIFHLDEYAGIDPDHPASFRRFLAEHLLSEISPDAFYPIQGENPDLAAECERYTELLNLVPPQLAILGIGENGHIAFNDPPVCRFDDPYDVKPVLLDEACRQQQVFDGAFTALEEVPVVALTLTVARLMRVPRILTIVPGTRKAPAVKAALEGPIAESCPASVLRIHPNVSFYLDSDAAGLLASPVAAVKETR